MSTARRSPTDTGHKYRVQVLDRAIDLLEALGAGDREHALAVLAARVSLHKSTAHRLLNVLERRRLVERTGSGSEYCLGMHLFELGMKAVGRLSFDAARPFLRALTEQTGETAHLGVLREGDIVSLVNADSRHALHSPSTVGRRTPAYCSSQGKAILAFTPNAAAASIAAGRFTAFTSNTIKTAAALRRELKAVRARGYAVDNEEFEIGLRCIGAPVRDHTGSVVAAISIAGPVFRIPRQRVPALARKVVAAAADLSRAFGSAVSSTQFARKR